MKTCSQCLFDKPENSEFFKLDKRTNKYYNPCLLCAKANRKKYKELNKEKILAQAKIYRQNNRVRINSLRRGNEKYKATNSKYRIINKKLINEQRKKYKLKKYHSDVQYKLHHSISVLIRKELKNKTSSILDILPYSILELKEHLEKQFEPWMNWNNHGVFSKLWNDNDQSTWTWQIDHIISRKLLKYSSCNDDNFKKCWNLSNLRPLSSKQNNLKGAK